MKQTATQDRIIRTSTIYYRGHAYYVMVPDTPEGILSGMERFKEAENTSGRRSRTETRPKFSACQLLPRGYPQ